MTTPHTITADELVDTVARLANARQALQAADAVLDASIEAGRTAPEGLHALISTAEAAIMNALGVAEVALKAATA